VIRSIIPTGLRVSNAVRSVRDPQGRAGCGLAGDDRQRSPAGRTSVRSFWRCLLALTIGIISAGPAAAHEMRPGYLEIRETAPEVYDVIWKVPARGFNERLSLRLKFADDVEIVGDAASGFSGGAHIQRMKIRRPAGLAGTPIAIEGLSGTFTDVLLRLQRLDGSEMVHRLTPSDPVWIVAATPSVWQVGQAYLVLGIEHILLGIDHLLFVLALLMIVSDWRKLVGTITAFTLAHSITLALATLGWVNVPGPPVEATIALSIVFVAAEVIRGQQGKPGLTARWPWLVAFTFGLLHGFGFAGALSEVGLPPTSIPMALLAFNVGVEAGQLAFVAILLVLYLALGRFSLARSRFAVALPAWMIGGIACFWVIERTVGFWSA
jgi:hydrogenase/urease accessory protein HupE